MTLRFFDHNFIEAVDHAGKRHGGRPNQQRSQSKLLSTRTPSTNVQLIVMWLALLPQLGSLSSSFIDIQESPNKDQLAGMVIDAFAASALFRYSPCMSKFLQISAHLPRDLATMTAVQLINIFLLGIECTGLDIIMTFNALICFHSQPGIAFFEVASHSLIHLWIHSKMPQTRREALPIPLHIIIQWERRLHQAGCTSTERLVLGGFILMIWSGLRFAGLQRITHKSLMTSFSEIHGLYWRPMISSRGQQWEFLASSFLSSSDFSWSMQWLLQWDPHISTQPFEDTALLIPRCNKDGPILPLQAKSQVEAPSWFRQGLSIPWQRSSICADITPLSHYIHCMKATFLSWGAQLGHKGIITDELRHLQGHYKTSQSSVTSCPCEDVRGQLEFHHRLANQMKHGSRTWIICQWPPAQTRGRQPTQSSDGNWSNVEQEDHSFEGAIALDHCRNTGQAMIPTATPIKHGAHFFED